MKRVQGFVFFWGSADVFSNWHPSVFSVGGIKFNCSEQYMMYAKAMLFGDTEMASAILAERSPREQKALGRKVRGYDDATWAAKCLDVMFIGLLAKFEQNPEMAKVLLDTEDNEIVEASPYDIIWGVGLSESDPRILDKTQWRGTNYLGVVLMRVREALRSKQATLAL